MKKTKPAFVAPIVELRAADARAAIVDEFGEADRRVKAFAPTQKRRDQLRDIITGWCPDAELEYPFSGEAYALIVSPRASVREIPARALYKALGLVRFLAAVKTTLKGASAFLGSCEVDALVVSARTGSREIAVTPRLAPAAELPKAA